MTYATPELLLVGAAQNLVLATCPFIEYDSDLGEHLSCVYDGQPIEYEPAPTW